MEEGKGRVELKRARSTRGKVGCESNVSGEEAHFGARWGWRHSSLLLLASVPA